MPFKRGQKRKTVVTTHDDTTNGNIVLISPDRNTWPGWVEMESEPAFFNVMLKDMGVRGVKIQEVVSMDAEMLAVLPHPVHALIFLFKYHKDDEQQDDTTATTSTDHIWFANQIPDFACATVALLNIINNIPSLEMGKELHDFKAFTKDMDPMTKGDMIDGFDFVKHIHNSFARTNDILNADMHTKEKLDKVKRKVAAAKARATKEANKLAQSSALQEDSPNISTAVAPRRNNTDATNISLQRVRSTRSRGFGSDDDPDIIFKTKTKSIDIDNAHGSHKTDLRRSGRAPKSRNDTWTVESEKDVPESGFHFVAYMPVQGRVWKLDGLDHHPTDIGDFGTSVEDVHGENDNWIDKVCPTIMHRMLQFQEDTVEFNLMAVVHDPAITEKTELLQNIKAIQALELKLDSIAEDWRDMDNAATPKQVVTGISPVFDITQANIEAATLSAQQLNDIEGEAGFLELIELRQRIISQQSMLRASLQDSMMTSADDLEKARQRRHDYSSFVRGWLGALAEQEALGGIVDDE